MHTTPYLNYTPITPRTAHHLRLSNLDDLNEFGKHVYLTSDDDPSNPPSWLRGDRNIPSDSKSGTGDDIGLSSAPVIIIWTEKAGGVVDAFYFYFYSFNLGNTVAGWRFGNHVGDWGGLLPPLRLYIVSCADESRTYGPEICERQACEHVFQRAQWRFGL